MVPAPSNCDLYWPLFALCRASCHFMECMDSLVVHGVHPTQLLFERDPPSLEIEQFIPFVEGKKQETDDDLEDCLRSLVRLHSLELDGQSLWILPPPSRRCLSCPGILLFALEIDRILYAQSLCLHPLQHQIHHFQYIGALQTCCHCSCSFSSPKGSRYGESAKPSERR